MIDEPNNFRSHINSLLLSGGIDGKASIYDLNRKTMVNHVKYSSSVTCIKWLPSEVIQNYYVNLGLSWKMIYVHKKLITPFKIFSKC